MPPVRDALPPVRDALTAVGDTETPVRETPTTAEDAQIPVRDLQTPVEDSQTSVPAVETPVTTIKAIVFIVVTTVCEARTLFSEMNAGCRRIHIDKIILKKITPLCYKWPSVATNIYIKNKMFVVECAPEG